MTFLWTAALSVPLFLVFALVRIRRPDSRKTPPATVGDWLAYFLLWVASSTLFLAGIAGISAELMHKVGWFHLQGSPGKTAYFRLPATEVKSLKGEWTAQEGFFVRASAPGQPPAESRWRVVAWSDYEKRDAFYFHAQRPDEWEPILEGEIAVPPAPDLVGQQFEGVLEARIGYPAYLEGTKGRFEERTVTVSIPCQLSVETANPIRNAVNFLDRKDKERADQQGGWVWALPLLSGALGLVPISLHGPAGLLSSLGDLVAFLSNRN